MSSFKCGRDTDAMFIMLVNILETSQGVVQAGQYVVWLVDVALTL